jgi:ketosteroid isomerase-like protein
MSQANVSRVQELYAAFVRGDIATIVNAASPDIHWESVGRPADYPAYGLRKGRVGMQEFFKLVGDNIAFSEFSPRGFYAVDDKVFVLGHYAGTTTKTGRKFSSDWVHIFSFRDAQVTSFREFSDTAQIAEAYRGS